MLREFDVVNNPVGYGYNWAMGNAGCVSGTQKPLPTTATIKDPATTIMNADASGPVMYWGHIYRSNTCGGVSDPNCWATQQLGTYQTWLSGGWDAFARHNGGENIGFADGHVKWFKSQYIMSQEALGWAQDPACQLKIYFW